MDPNNYAGRRTSRRQDPDELGQQHASTKTSRAAPSNPVPVRRPQDRDPALPDRLHRQPARDPALRNRRVLLREMPAVLAGGQPSNRSKGFGFAPLYNLQPHPQEPALTAFWVPLVQAPVFISLAGGPRATTGSTPKARRSSARCPTSTTWVSNCGACPAADPHERTVRTAADRLRPLPRNSRTTAPATAKRERRRTSPPIPYLENPTDLRRAAHRADVAPLLHRWTSSKRNCPGRARPAASSSPSIRA